ncbi:hypothetical protein SAMN04489842_2449 [Natronobacterium texcoconense]|uniref:Uncharacterized protein n=1 Tax=Natronobacterium texcoconense TaxID=1095778 RepID=A0A1H1GIG0_NATTX|nr:hypothetical protein SAMN04489842_2449 [Natronobacterium texcoconense]
MDAKKLGVAFLVLVSVAAGVAVGQTVDVTPTMRLTIGVVVAIGTVLLVVRETKSG